MDNSLIYGKDQTKNIVSMEDTGNGFMELFIQDDKGKITSKFVKNDYWILTNRSADEQSIKLEGSGYFKYKNLFSLREDFEYAKKQFYKFKDQCFWINDAKESFMVSNGYTYYKGLKHTEVSVLSFDLETTGIEHNAESKILCISNTFRDSKGNVTRKLFCYDDYSNEKEMLFAWTEFVQKCDASIILGHNIFSFDLPYLDYIAARNDIELYLGRNNKPLKFSKWPSKFRKDGSQEYSYNKAYIPGREIIDSFFLSIRYDVARNYESYALKAIIKHEGLEVKDRQFYDAGLIRKNYLIPDEWIKIKKYAEHDSDDSLALWDLMGSASFYWTQKVPKSLQEIVCGAPGSQLNAMMIRSYLQEEYSLPKASETGEFQGAISKGNAGIYKYALKFDITSLYPSIVLQYEIFDKEKDPKANFYNIVRSLREYRIENKKLATKTGERYYTNLEQSEKVGVNSAYGLLSTKGLLFNSPKNASKITHYGRDILNLSLKWAEQKEFQLLNADTDSLTFSNNSEFSKEEQKNLLQDLNSNFPEYIKFEPDGYFPVMVVLKIKNYVMLTEDGKVKIKGSALKSSKLEKALSKFQREIIDAILYEKNNYTDIYNKYAKEAMNITDIKNWSSKKTVTSKVLEGTRSNETKVKDAIVGSEYRESDKIWVYFKNDNSLSLAENFDGDYNKKKMLEKLYKTSKVFNSVLPKDLFINYGLKKNKKLLEEFCV